MLINSACKEGTLSQLLEILSCEEISRDFYVQKKYESTDHKITQLVKKIFVCALVALFIQMFGWYVSISGSLLASVIAVAIIIITMDKPIEFVFSNFKIINDRYKRRRQIHLEEAKFLALATFEKKIREAQLDIALHDAVAFSDHLHEYKRLQERKKDLLEKLN